MTASASTVSSMVGLMTGSWITVGDDLETERDLLDVSDSVLVHDGHDRTHRSIQGPFNPEVIGDIRIVAVADFTEGRVDPAFDVVLRTGIGLTSRKSMTAVEPPEGCLGIRPCIRSAAEIQFYALHETGGVFGGVTTRVELVISGGWTIRIVTGSVTWSKVQKVTVSSSPSG